MYIELAAAYVRGACPDAPGSASSEELIEFGRAAGLKLHRFKRTSALPRVQAVIGVLRGLAPTNLLDIGTGRGVFLWPLLDAFPQLEVTAVERDKRRADHLMAVREGGVARLKVLQHEAAALYYENDPFDVVTVLEVLEHQENPLQLATEAVRLASRFVIASVPSKEDNNPEHIQLFTGDSLRDLLITAGARSVKIDYVLNHIIAVARVY